MHRESVEDIKDELADIERRLDVLYRDRLAATSTEDLDSINDHIGRLLRHKRSIVECRPLDTISVDFEYYKGEPDEDIKW